MSAFRVCSLVQQLKKKLVHKNRATRPWLPHSLFKFFLKFLDQRCWRFSEGYLNNFSTELLSQISDCCPTNFLIQEKQNDNVVSTSHWIRPVLMVLSGISFCMTALCLSAWPQSISLPFGIFEGGVVVKCTGCFTARNKVGARQYFHRHLWFCSQGGGGSASMMVGYHTP